MKDKIIVFVIGLLVGAVITTGAFYIYTLSSNKCDSISQNTGMNGGQPPEKPNGENGQPPEKPSDSNIGINNTQESD